MREALGLAPKRAAKPQGSRLDKHEYAELVKRGSTAEDLGAGHGESAWVHGLGFARLPRPQEDSGSLSSPKPESIQQMDAPIPAPSSRNDDKESEDENDRKRRKNEEKKHGKHEKRDKYEKRDKRHSRDSDDRRKHKDKKRRHDSD